MIFGLRRRIQDYFGFKRVAKEMEEYYWKHPLECMSNPDLLYMIDGLNEDYFERLEDFVKCSRDRREKEKTSKK